MWLCRVVVVTCLLCLMTLPSLGRVHHSAEEVKEPDTPTQGTPLQDDEPNCGYKACPKPLPGKLNVHLVPHSHDDVGWLKTVDQYYYGSKNYIQKAGVQYILGSVVEELTGDPKKKFVFVETAFFWKWWIRQDEAVQKQVKKLVDNGQLEFAGGAWSMNDEACTHYQAIIDHFTWGLRRLNDTFGKCGQPRVGWQIDPFGHSRGMASIFAELGYDGLFIGRLDYQDKENRQESKTLEMVWEGSPNLGKTANLFTSVLYNRYSPPLGFCFDILCNDEPFIDNNKSVNYNVPTLVDTFIDYAEEQAKHYTTNNIVMTMGDDFHYQDARTWYKNLDKLIRYVNERQGKGKSRVNVFYSTPSCYIKAVHDSNKTWTTKNDDFFPYANDEHSYWTGYFTSRPTLKGFERMGNNFLQVCKQLHSLTDLGPEDWVDLSTMREAMGILQHHDAVTGTSRQKVAFDYARILHKGFKECELITQTALNKIIAPKTKIQEETEIPTSNLLPMKSCLLLNISQCDVSENSSKFVVTIYNPLSRPVSIPVRFPVTGPSYTVQDPRGKKLTVDMVPIRKATRNIPGRHSNAAMELVFLAKDLPPLGFRSYYVSKSNHIDRSKKSKLPSDRDIVMGSSKFRIIFNGKTGELKSIKVDGIEIATGHAFFYYKGHSFDSSGRASGAYVFRPNGNPIRMKQTHTQTYAGNNVIEIYIEYSDWCSHVWRWYLLNESIIEFQWLVGPIPIKDNVGKEIIHRLVPDVKSDALFYTDTNGRETLERKRNFRPTWNVTLEEPASGNYYPVTSKIAIRDEKSKYEFAFLPDRTHGGSSLIDGKIELMVHRRLLYDDGLGVGEPLNETAYGKGLVATGKHWLVAGKFGMYSDLAEHEHDQMEQISMAPWLFFTAADNTSFDTWSKKYKMEFTGLTESLKKNIKILTLEPWKDRTFLLRLEHIYEKDESSKYSKPVKVNLRNLFTPFTIVNVRETTLGANQWLDEATRFQWNTKSDFENKEMEEESASGSSSEDTDGTFVITLQPKQIRTFVIKVKKSHLLRPADNSDMLMEE